MIMSKYLIFVLIFTLLTGLNDASGRGLKQRNSRRFFFTCTGGLLYRENNCKFCLCILGLLSTCIGLGCDSDEYYSLKQCKIGSYWKNGCNDCTCVRDLGSVCTTHDCCGNNNCGYQRPNYG